MNLPNDVSRCHNATCPFRKNCLRWILRGDAIDLARYVAAYFAPSATGCRYMIQAQPKSEPIQP